MPLISVVIPAYNAERTILETIESVQQQTFSDFEIIVINDGSTDRTLGLLETVKDTRLKILSYSNGGISIARNRGIALASGEFITFIDADDLWTRDKLELQLTALQRHPEAGVAYSWTCNMSEKGESFYEGKSVSFEGNVFAQFLHGNFIANGSNILIRKQAIESVGGFDPTLAPCADWDFFLRLAHRWSFVVVPKTQILYRQSSGSMSSKIEVMEKDALLVIERAFQSAPPEFYVLKNQSLANANNVEQVKRAAQKLQMAIRFYPQILLDRIIQRYILKVLIMRILSPNFARYFTRPLSRVLCISDPRLE